MKIAVVVTFAICVLVFLLLPDDSQAGKTKKGPLVTEKVGFNCSVFRRTICPCSSITSCAKSVLKYYG